MVKNNDKQQQQQQQQQQQEEEKTAAANVKLIKTTGNGGLTRTSQACDRCRIKKIKCDGKIPSCTNCLSIGYNCQTSDKLTRRAFPRGYTENLEKNLISLQNENSKLITELDSLKKSLATSSKGTCDAPGGSHSPSSVLPSVPISTAIDCGSPVSGGGFEENDALHREALSENFFRFDNFIEKDNYVGLNSLNLLFNEMLSTFKLDPIEELKFPAVDFTNVYDFLLNKFLIKFPSKTNLDLLISNHFENLNLIPILDEDAFFNTYKDVFNSIDNKTENLVTLLRQSMEIQDQSQDANLIFITNLILIIQLNCSIFNLHEIHKLISSLNLHFNMTIQKFQTILLCLYLFQNKNCYKNTVISLTNLSHSAVLTLGLHLNYNNLKQNSTGVSMSKDDRFKMHSVRLKLYWSFYILSSISAITFGLPQVGFFSRFEVPQLSTILNSNKNLNNCILLIELLKNLEDINIMSIDEEPEALSEIDQKLATWRKDLKLQNLFHKIPIGSIPNDALDSRPTKRLKKLKVMSSKEEVHKIQMNLFYLYFRLLIHLKSSYSNSAINQSEYILSNISREFLAYVILLDSKKELNNLNNFEFHLIPINFLKITLISMLNLVKISKDFNKNGALFNDSNRILVKILKIIKNRYPENFVTFKNLVNFIENKFQLNEDEAKIRSYEMEHAQLQSSTSNRNQVSQPSLFSDSNLHSISNRNTTDASSGSISSSNSNLTFSSSFDSRKFSTESDTSSIDELPDIPSNLDILFDWNSTLKDDHFKVDQKVNDGSVFNEKINDNHTTAHPTVNAYDLSYITQT